MDDFDNLQCEDFYVENEYIPVSEMEDEFEDDDDLDEECDCGDCEECDFWENYDSRIGDDNEFPYGTDVIDTNPEFDE